MKENFKNYWKKNGFYMVLTAALVVVLGISGVAGYRSGMKDKAEAEKAAEFSQAENTPEVLDETPAAAVGNMTDIENAVAESVAAAEAANAAVAETFGDNAKMVWPVEGENWINTNVIRHCSSKPTSIRKWLRPLAEP